jgi:hypothetical protein
MHLGEKTDNPRFEFPMRSFTYQALWLRLQSYQPESTTRELGLQGMWRETKRVHVIFQNQGIKIKYLFWDLMKK